MAHSLPHVVCLSQISTSLYFGLLPSLCQSLVLLCLQHVGREGCYGLTLRRFGAGGYAMMGRWWRLAGVSSRVDAFGGGARRVRHLVVLVSLGQQVGFVDDGFLVGT